MHGPVIESGLACQKLVLLSRPEGEIIYQVTSNAYTGVDCNEIFPSSTVRVENGFPPIVFPKGACNFHVPGQYREAVLPALLPTDSKYFSSSAP